MFIGGLPEPTLYQIATSTDIGSWRSAWVMCSGSFRIERTLHQFYPALEIHSNDVSLLSTAVGALATKKPFELKYVDQLEWFEEHLGPDCKFIDRVAALLIAGELSPFMKGKTNLYKRQHIEFIKERFDPLLEAGKAKLAKFTESLSVTSYHCDDFRNQIERAKDAGGGIIGFPPTYKGGYETQYSFLHANTVWPVPEYPVFDPEKFPEIVDEIAASGIPWIIGGDQEIPGRKPISEFRPGRNRPILTYADEGRNSFRAKAATKAEPFGYKTIELDLVTEKSVVSIVRIDSAKANYIKDIYLAKHITHTNGMVNFAVMIDDMLAGMLIYARSTHQAYSKTEIYLLSDLSTSRDGKLSKLIARMALSSTIMRELEKWMVSRFDFVVTTAFSKHPVSMKYRGVFKLLKRTEAEGGDGYLLNYGHERLNETPQQIFEWWWKKYGEKTGKHSGSAGSENRNGNPNGKGKVASGAEKERALHEVGSDEPAQGKRSKGRRADKPSSGVSA